ncbi:MAG TPA: hypothetical protein VNT76_16750, partial [Candidatus Binatus sp.]|nr:hypothetical protein [Candidatus Binatus sp.]
LNDNEFQRDANQLVSALARVPELQRRAKAAANEKKLAVRKRLFRRLLWKAPIILLLISFAVWWQWHKEQEQSRGSQNSVVVSRNTAAFAGDWSAEISYPWGVKMNEQFFFQPEGDKIFGTASFLGVKRGIEEGQFVGETMFFKVRYEEVADSTTRLRWNRYEGQLVSKEIHLKLFDDKGSPPVEVTLIQTSPNKSAPQSSRP